MKRSGITLLMVVFLGLFSTLSLATEKEPEGESVIIDEDIWILLVDEPSGYLQDARESFLLGDTEDAAFNIRKALASIKLESYRAKNEAKKGLKSSASELGRIAKLVEKRLTTGIKLEEAFSRAEYALAEHYHQLAQDYEANEQYEKAAAAIEASVSHLLFASFWSKESLEEADIIDVKKARSSAKEMASESKFKKNKISKAIKGVGRGIKKLAKKIKPFEPQDEETPRLR